VGKIDQNCDINEFEGKLDHKNKKASGLNP